jgi:hypothetical protein
MFVGRSINGFLRFIEHTSGVPDRVPSESVHVLVVLPGDISKSQFRRQSKEGKRRKEERNACINFHFGFWCAYLGQRLKEFYLLRIVSIPTSNFPAAKLKNRHFAKY